MKTLVILSRLESLHLPYTLQNLEQCSKSSLVVSDLCSEYQIWTPTQWSALLDRMCSLGMLSDLSTTLITLNSHPQLWNSPQYLRAWNMVLQSPLAGAVPPLSQEQLLQCQQSFKLIHFCPTATDLDLRTLVEECVRLEMTDLAQQTLLPYLTSSPELLKLMTENKKLLASTIEKTSQSYSNNGETSTIMKKEIKVESRYSTSPAL